MQRQELLVLAVNVNDPVDLKGLLYHSLVGHLDYIAMISQRSLDSLGPDGWIGLRRHARRLNPALRFQLDHVPGLEVVASLTSEGITKEIDLLMIDGPPTSSSEQAIRLASAAVRMLPAVAIEAEVGKVGGPNVANHLTRPRDIERLLDEVDVPYVAVSVGNRHDEVQRRIDLELVEALRGPLGNRVLVLHGSDYVSITDLCSMAESGPTKINIGPLYRRRYSSLLNQARFDPADPRPNFEQISTDLAGFLAEFEQSILGNV